MTNTVVFIILGIVIAVLVWQLIVWLIEIQDKNRKYKAALDSARKSGKPFLIAGGPWGAKRTRRVLNRPAHGSGDVCIDIDRNAIGKHPNGVIGNVTNIPFSDNCFGAAFASHLLEHLPNVEEAEKAMAELNRTAEAVFIVYPARQSIVSWLMPAHHLRVWQQGDTIYFRQMG